MSAIPTRSARSMIALLGAAVLLTGCSSAIAGQAMKIGAVSKTTSTPAQQDDGPTGLKPDAPTPDVTVKNDANTKWDKQAKDTVADLYDYYGQIFPKEFGKKFVPAKLLMSYDSNDKSAAVCGRSLAGSVNASYNPACDAIVWDRGELLPDMATKVGDLAAPTILAHEMGHLVQNRMGMRITNQSQILTAEQQADCYAGAYWRWVADGNSKYYDLNQSKGMREVLTAALYIGDPVGTTPGTVNAHGNAFDRSFALTLGFTNGAARCKKIDEAEVQSRITETGFTKPPTGYANLPVDDKLIGQVTDLLNDYFAQRFQGYKKPTLSAFDGDKGPDCSGGAGTFPVGYCASTNTVTYNLAELKRLGTPTKGFASQNGDFTSMMLIASRYGLAAQATTGGAVTGDQAGLRGLCYVGTWANWLRTPQGSNHLQLSPNDLDKAVYAVLASAMPASDANGNTSTRVIDQVQALYVGVIYGKTAQCYDFYAG